MSGTEFDVGGIILAMSRKKTTRANMAPNESVIFSPSSVGKKKTHTDNELNNIVGIIMLTM